MIFIKHLVGDAELWIQENMGPDYPQTAAGDDRAALGLAGVAVKSGARSAIATLWFVNDRASSVLVSEFYRNLQDRQLSKAQALQRAQLAVQRMPQYRHPAYWSAYLLIGNWL